ncbi:MAG: Calx-beta domain-containing protein [Pseudomonadota bacterium]
MEPEISVASASSVEGNNMSFVVTLSEASLADVTVQWRLVQDGSAVIDGNDFFNVSGKNTSTLTILAGDTQGIIQVGSDNISTEDEFDENFTLELTDPTGATLAGGEPVLTATGVFFDNDGASTDRGLFVSDPVIIEGTGGTKQAVFEVRLSEAVPGGITLDFETADGTATAGTDYVAKSGQVSFTGSQTVVPVVVDIIGDSLAETAETFSLVVSPTSAIFNNVEDSAGVATLLDDDTSQSLPEISISGGEATEGTNVVFAVRLSEPSLSDVTVQWRLVADGAAVTDNNDFFNVSGKVTQSITIPAGETQVTIEVGSDNNSNEDEFDENFTVELSDPSGAVLAGGGPVLTATGIFLDDDGSTNDRALFVSDPVILEGTGGGTKQAVFELSLSEPFTSDITVNYTTRDGTARAGEDYVAKSGSVTFKAGQQIASVAVDVIQDSVDEAPESFSLVVDPVLPIFNSVEDSAGVATLLDDDTGGALPTISVVPGTATEGTNVVFAVHLSEPSLQDVTVQYRLVADGSAVIDNNDFFNVADKETKLLTFTAGETVQTILVGSDNNSSEDEFDENFSLELSDPNGAVLAGGEPVLKATGVFFDDDGASTDRALFVSDPIILEGDGGSKQAVFEVRLSEAFDSDIVLDFTTADGTALAGSDYVAKSGTITFDAGQTVASIAVDLISDTVRETTESFSLLVDTDLPIFNNVEDSEGIATILDDDTSGSLPEISVTFADATEGTNVVFAVRLTEPSLSDVSVDWRLVPDGSATLDSSDFLSSNVTQTSTVVIPAGETQITVLVGSDNNSSVDEFDENFSIELSNPSGAVLSGGEPVIKATGVFFDNDGSTNDRAIFVSDPDILEGTASGKQAVFEIRLSEAHTSPLVLDYTTADVTASAGSDYLAKSGTVTFAAGQTVTSVAVDIIGDAVAEGNETFNLVVTPVLPIFGAGDAVGVATLRNDDAPGVIRTGTPGNDSLVGTSGSDSLFGQTGNDTLEGLGGADSLRGDAGFDVIRAGGGDDSVDGGAQADSIFGGTGNDTLIGNQGADRIFGEAGFDTIFGGDNNDTIDGGAQADAINGGDGDDSLIGGDGFDVINGDAGNDTLFGGAIADRLDGGAGNDLLFGGSNLGITVDGLRGGSGNDTILGEGGFDLLDGGFGNDLMNGGGQADNLFGRAGDDTLLGEQGLDRLFGGSGNDVLDGGSDNDGLFGEEGNDILRGGTGTDRFFGGSGNDLMDGGSGSDTLNGGSGFDTITGGTGNDVIFGRFNADTFVFADGHGADVIGDFNALNVFEKLDFSGLSTLNSLSDALTAATQVNGDTVIATGGGSSIVLENVLRADLDITDFIF